MGIYHRPGKLKDALAILATSSVRPVAGCTDVFASTEAQELDGSILDITGIDALRGIERTVDGWRIGATTTWRDVRDTSLPAAFDMLKQAASEVGGVQVQNTGTVAGNICNASPAADGMPALLALDAVVELASDRDSRQVGLAEFVTGPRKTTRRDGELVTAILIPASSTTGASRFLKLGARKHLVISIAMVAVRLEIKRNLITEAAVSVGACGPVARRAPRLEAALLGTEKFGADHLVSYELLSDVLEPVSDIRGDAKFRRSAAIELVRRAVSDVMEAVP